MSFFFTDGYVRRPMNRQHHKKSDRPWYLWQVRPGQTRISLQRHDSRFILTLLKTLTHTNTHLENWFPLSLWSFKDSWHLIWVGSFHSTHLRYLHKPLQLVQRLPHRSLLLHRRLRSLLCTRTNLTLFGNQNSIWSLLPSTKSKGPNCLASCAKKPFKSLQCQLSRLVMALECLQKL